MNEIMTMNIYWFSLMVAAETCVLLILTAWIADRLFPDKPTVSKESVSLEFTVQADEAIQKLEELKKKMSEVEMQKNKLDI